MNAGRLTLLFMVYLFSQLPAMAQGKNVQDTDNAMNMISGSRTPSPQFAYVFLVKGLYSASDVERFNEEVSKSPLIKSIFTDLHENTCKLEVTSSTIEESLRALLFAAGHTIGRSLSIELLDGPFIN